MEEKDVVTEQKDTDLEENEPTEMSQPETPTEKKKSCSKKKKVLVTSFICIICVALIIGLIALINPYFFYDIYGGFLSKKEFPQKQELIAAQQSNGQKMLIVYQPSTHTTITEDMAHNIAQGASEKGIDVTLMRPGKDASVDIKDFDVIVFGAPWYMHPSQKMLEYIKRIDSLAGKKVYMFSTQGGEDTYTDIFASYSEEVKAKGAEVISQELYTYESYDKALDFGRKIGEK